MTTYSPRNGAIKSSDLGARRVAGTFGKAAHLTLPGKDKTCIVESAAERLATDAFALDPDVRGYAAQPYTVDLMDGVLLRSAEERRLAFGKHAAAGTEATFYTPDFDIEWVLGTHSAIEIKLEGYAGDALYQEKLLKARDVLWSHGVEFLQLVIPSYWRHPLRTNLPLLHQAKLRDDLAPSAEILDQVDRLAAAGACTLREFCTGLGFDNRMSPVLITHGALDVDFLHQTLLDSTPAKPAHGGLAHLSVVRRLVI